MLRRATRNVFIHPPATKYAIAYYVGNHLLEHEVGSFTLDYSQLETLYSFENAFSLVVGSRSDVELWHYGR